MQNSFIYKFHISPAWSHDATPRIQRALESLDQVIRADINRKKSIGRIITKRAYSLDEIREVLLSLGFHIVPFGEKNEMQEYAFSFSMEGMTCKSCEVLIEERWKKIEGVTRVQADASKNHVRVFAKTSTLDTNLLQEKISQAGYRIQSLHKGASAIEKNKRPSSLRLVGLFCIVFGLGILASKFNILKPSIAFGEQVSVASAFLLGLVAATSSCIAVTGGVLLSTITQYKKRVEESGKKASISIPLISFVVGRIISYGLFGAAIGLIGKSLAISPLVTGGITLIAALYMIFMGLDILQCVPLWAKQWMPRMPKKISGAIVRYEGHSHPIIPFLLGAGTFFLPCGFTQSLQLYALTTGSVLTSSLILSVFALGTAPALFLLGYASHSLKGKVGTFFYQFSGALVVMLGIWNIGNGFAAAGAPLPDFYSIQKSIFSTSQVGDVNNTLVPFDGKQQVMNMTVESAGYAPNTFTLRKGVPTRWVINAQDAQGCLSVLVSQKLGIQKLLARGQNVIEFTPQETGSIPFSCSMGMYRGTIDVVANS